MEERHSRHEQKNNLTAPQVSRAKSHDRVQGNSRFDNYSQNETIQECQPSRAQEILHGTQSQLDGMKRDLTDKDRLIEQKNREIVKLRMENDEYKSNFE